MDTEFKFPSLHLCIGDAAVFAIDVVFPAFGAKISESPDASCILPLTDGYVTFFVDGANVFQLDSQEAASSRLHSHTRFSLSMFLEWVFFDKAYLPNGGAISFSEIVGGESTPGLLFAVKNGIVAISWDLRDWSRNGLQYVTKVGQGYVDYGSYLACLSLAVEIVLVMCEGRARTAGVREQWHKWLEGYDSEADAFRGHATAFISPQNRYVGPGDARA